jgi:hypothetical protein
MIPIKAHKEVVNGFWNNQALSDLLGFTYINIWRPDSAYGCENSACSQRWETMAVSPTTASKFFTNTR